MAADKTGNPEEPSSPNQEPLLALDKFLAKFVDLVSQIPKGMLAQSVDADEKELIAAYAGPLTEQVTQLSDYMRQKAKSSSRQVAEEIGTILRLTGAERLTESGMRVTQNLASHTSRIGISDIIKLIKKIISALADLFHIHLPSWFQPLLDLIDEIIDFLVSIGVLKLSSALSRRHQDYMNELAALERWKKAKAWRKSNDEEEEE